MHILYAVRAYRSIQTQTPPRNLNRGRRASPRGHFVCSSCVPLDRNTKHLLALWGGRPHVVATSYAARAYRSIETQNKPPRTLNGGRRALRRGHLACSINRMHFVRTAQSKHKHPLALSTEDGGPHGGRGAPRPPRPEPLLIVLTTPLSRLFRHQDTKAMRWLDWMWSFAAKLRGTRVRNRLAPPCHCRCPFSTHTHTHADPPLGGSMRMT